MNLSAEAIADSTDLLNSVVLLHGCRRLHDNWVYPAGRVASQPLHQIKPRLRVQLHWVAVEESAELGAFGLRTGEVGGCCRRC